MSFKDLHTCRTVFQPADLNLKRFKKTHTHRSCSDPVHVCCSHCFSAEFWSWEQNKQQQQQDGWSWNLLWSFTVRSSNHTGCQQSLWLLWPLRLSDLWVKRLDRKRHRQTLGLPSCRSAAGFFFLLDYSETEAEWETKAQVIGPQGRILGRGHHFTCSAHLSAAFCFSVKKKHFKDIFIYNFYFLILELYSSDWGICAIASITSDSSL